MRFTSNPSTKKVVSHAFPKDLNHIARGRAVCARGRKRAWPASDARAERQSQDTRRDFADGSIAGARADRSRAGLDARGKSDPDGQVLRLPQRPPEHAARAREQRRGLENRTGQEYLPRFAWAERRRPDL